MQPPSSCRMVCDLLQSCSSDKPRGLRKRKSLVKARQRGVFLESLYTEVLAVEAQIGKGTASGERGISIVSLLGQVRLTADWSFWVSGATSGWSSTEQPESLMEQSRKSLMQL